MSFMLHFFFTKTALETVKLNLMFLRHKIRFVLDGVQFIVWSGSKGSFRSRESLLAVS